MTEPLAMIRQAFVEESMSRTRVFESKKKQRRQVKDKVKSMLIIFFSIKGIVKRLVLAGQAVNFTYYCYVLRRLVKMCEDFAPNIGAKGTGRCIATTHRLSIPKTT
jgi:hypothetical protein